MRFACAYALMTLWLLAGCATSPKRASKAAPEPLPPPAPCVRVAQTHSNLFEFQIAVRKLVPARGKGPAIWLAGVSHIGERDYYTLLQQHLDHQTLVLFEGVGAGERAPKQSPEGSTAASPGPPGRATSSRSSLQSSLAASLGLVFQLEAIDYRRTNYVNSDVTVEELRELVSASNEAPGNAGARESMDDLLQFMEGGSWLDSALQLGLRLLGANPKFQALGRLTLMELLGRIEGDPTKLGKLPPHMKQVLEALLHRRNDVVLEDLKIRLPTLKPRDSVAVFYGTAHMPDLEQRLGQEFRYRPAESIWLTAFAVDLAKSGVTASERQFVLNVVQYQLNQLQAPQ
jgi:hypothetical protein